MEAKLSCVIIDDEPLAQELIEKFVKRIPSLTLLGIFDNAIEALEVIDEIRPDIIFLDISMPEMTGIEFIRSFSKIRPNIIMTTAHPQFAIDGFEYDVVDYLLKPIPFDRFVKAINKVRDKIHAATSPNSEQKLLGGVPSGGVPSGGVPPTKTPEFAIINIPKPESNEPKEIEDDELLEEGLIKDNFLWVKEDRKLVKIDFNEIVYVEGMKDYIKIFLPKTMIITYMRMSKMENVLATRKRFLRINRSFIINTKYMAALDGNQIELENGKKLPIGTNYRDIIKNAMRSQLP